MGIFSISVKKDIVNSFHFWAITGITLLLILIYQLWPWRVWYFDNGALQHFSWISFLYKLALIEFTNNIIGTLFFIPIIYASIVFPWKGVLIITLLSLIGVLPSVVDIWPIKNTLANIALLLVPFTIVSIAYFEITWCRKEKKYFADREKEHNIYISKILEAQENERRRISQELHDDTIQTLLVIANNANLLVTLVQCNDSNISKVKTEIEKVRDMTLREIENLRRISLDLRPSILDDLGLVPALRWLVDRINNESDTCFSISVNGEDRELPPRSRVAMLRVTQEALSNIRRHSKAKEAVIDLNFTAEFLELTIKDDGQGFYPKNIEKYAAEGKLGLIGIKQRLDSIGGTFQISSKHNEGTLLTIKLDY